MDDDQKKPETMRTVIHTTQFRRDYYERCPVAPEPGRSAMGKLISAVQHGDVWELYYEIIDSSELTWADKSWLYRNHSQSAKEDPAFAATLEPVYDAMMERRRQHGYSVPPFAERADA